MAYPYRRGAWRRRRTKPAVSVARVLPPWYLWGEMPDDATSPEPVRVASAEVADLRSAMTPRFNFFFRWFVGRVAARDNQRKGK